MSLQTKLLGRKRILLVDDELAVRDSLRLLLLRESHIVVEANNGAEAFALFRKERFDLVVTDFEMPFVKGNELAARIKQMAPRQPILMITAYDHRPGKGNPVDTVLTKPFGAQELRDVLGQLLNQPGENSPGLKAGPPSSTTGLGSEPERRWC
jgi:CheY-like chemotaxis protein